MISAVIKEIDEQKRIVMEDVPVPEIKDNEVMVKVGAVGICGSDLHGFLDPKSRGRIPGLIMGHEAAGKVVKIGSQVTNLKVGDRVAVDPQYVCGTCDACLHGWYTVCENKRIIGSALRGFMQGAMAEFVAVDQKQVYILPENVSLEEGAMVEPASNAVHVLNRVKFNLGDTVVVIGAGTLGLCILQAAKLAGAGTVIVTDMSKYRLGIAKELGADVTIQAGSSADPLAEVLQYTKGRGADVVIEAVGVEKTYRDAIAMVRKRGTIMFFGAVQEVVGVDLYPILHKELHLIGCTGADYWEGAMAVDLIAKGKIKVKPIITHRKQLDETAEAFDLLTDPANNAIKVMILVDKEEDN